MFHPSVENGLAVRFAEDDDEVVRREEEWFRLPVDLARDKQERRVGFGCWEIRRDSQDDCRAQGVGEDAVAELLREGHEGDLSR